MSTTATAMPPAALKLSTVLSLTALTIAVLQGVIGLESSRPVRLSLHKTWLLLGLQFVLFFVILGAEVVNLLEALKNLRYALQHLSWTPVLLFFLGLLAFLQDTLYTLHAVCSSRIYWIPLCETRRSDDRMWETGPLILTGGFVAVLVCWRQKWGFAETLVREQSSRNTRSLTPALIGFTILVAFVGAIVATVLALGLLRKNSPGNLIRDLKHLHKPLEYRKYASSVKSAGMRDRRQCSEVDEARTKRQLRYLVELQREDEGLAQLDNKDIDSFLYYTPLHVRNLIVGEDQWFILPCRVPFKMLKKYGFDVFDTLSVVQLLSICPLLLVTVIAMFRLRGFFTIDKFRAFKELVDIVLMYSSLNISFGLKRLLWSFSGCLESEMRGDLELDPKMRYERSSKEDRAPPGADVEGQST